MVYSQTGFWSPRDRPVAVSLQGLEDRMKTTVLSSKANGTVEAYNHAFRKWRQFALDKLDGKAFPASRVRSSSCMRPTQFFASLCTPRVGSWQASQNKLIFLHYCVTCCEVETKYGISND